MESLRVPVWNSLHILTQPSRTVEDISVSARNRCATTCRASAGQDYENKKQYRTIYKAENYEPAVQKLARILCCTYCLQLLTTLNNIVHLNNAGTILLTTVNNRCSTILLQLGFINIATKLMIFTRVQQQQLTTKQW